MEHNVDKLSDILFAEEFDLFHELGFQRQTAVSPLFQMPVRIRFIPFIQYYIFKFSVIWIFLISIIQLDQYNERRATLEAAATCFAEQREWCNQQVLRYVIDMLVLFLFAAIS